MDGVQQAFGVLIVLALLGALVWVLRRKGLLAANTGRRGRYAGLHFEVVQRLPLTPQHSLHLVRLAGHAVLVAVSPGGCTAIDTFEWTEIGAQAASAECHGPSGALRSMLQDTRGGIPPRAGCCATLPENVS